MLPSIIAPPRPPLNTPLRNPCTSTCQTIMCFHLSDISCGRSTEITDTILYKRVCTYKPGCLRLRRPTSNWEKIPYRLKEKNHKCCVNLFFLDLLSPFQKHSLCRVTREYENLFHHSGRTIIWTSTTLMARLVTFYSPRFISSFLKFEVPRYKAIFLAKKLINKKYYLYS